MSERPLDCTECKKPIAVLYTEIVGNRMTRTSMCADCPHLERRLYGTIRREHSSQEDDKQRRWSPHPPGRRASRRRCWPDRPTGLCIGVGCDSVTPAGAIVASAQSSAAGGGSIVSSWLSVEMNGVPVGERLLLAGRIAAERHRRLAAAGLPGRKRRELVLLLDLLDRLEVAGSTRPGCARVATPCWSGSGSCLRRRAACRSSPAGRSHRRRQCFPVEPVPM